MKANLIYSRIGHHAGHSGYDQLVKHLRPAIPLDVVGYLRPGFVPERLWQWMGARPGMKWYDSWSLALELDGLRRLLAHRGEIFHFLYGEDSCRYLPRVRPLLHLKRSALIASYHQPASILQEVLPGARSIASLDAVVVMAGNQVEFFSSLVPRDRIFTIPHGVDTGYFQPGPDPSSRYDCLVVGQWLRDFDTLKEIARASGSRGLPLRFHVISSETHRARFDGLANVIFRSKVPDAELLAAYQTAAVLVMPLTDCTANNALLEGMACGLPVVSNRVGGIEDYVSSECSILAPAGDVEGMLDGIMSIVEDAERRREMSLHSRELALTLDWSRVVPRVLDLYGLLLAVTEAPRCA